MSITSTGNILDNTDNSELREPLFTPDLPSAPVAIISGIASAEGGDEITLDASQSYSPTGESLTYAWTIVSLPAEDSIASIDGDTEITAFLDLIESGIYEIKLEVSDGSITRSATVVVDASRKASASVSASASLEGDPIRVRSTSATLHGSATMPPVDATIPLDFRITPEDESAYAGSPGSPGRGPALLLRRSSRYVLYFSEEDLGDLTKIVLWDRHEDTRTTLVDTFPIRPGVFGEGSTSKFFWISDSQASYPAGLKDTSDQTSQHLWTYHPASDTIDRITPLTDAVDTEDTDAWIPDFSVSENGRVAMVHNGSGFYEDTEQILESALWKDDSETEWNEIFKVTGSGDSGVQAIDISPDGRYIAIVMRLDEYFDGLTHPSMEQVALYDTVSDTRTLLTDSAVAKRQVIVDNVGDVTVITDNELDLGEFNTEVSGTKRYRIQSDTSTASPVIEQRGTDSEYTLSTLGDQDIVYLEDSALIYWEPENDNTGEYRLRLEWLLDSTEK